MVDEVELSVCVITYNQARYIAQAVESALMQQTDFPLEIVVGEDCSTDETRAILLDLQARHPSRLRLLLGDRNIGMMANLEKTFTECRGRYIAILEGDDYWTDPHKLQKQFEALEAHADWTVCFHSVRCMHEDGGQPDFVFPRTSPGEVLAIDDILRRNFIQTCSVVYRRVISELPAWLSTLKLGDWPLHILHAEHGKIGFLPRAREAGYQYSTFFDNDRLTTQMRSELCGIDRLSFGYHFAATRDSGAVTTLWRGTLTGSLARSGRR